MVELEPETEPRSQRWSRQWWGRDKGVGVTVLRVFP